MTYLNPFNINRLKINCFYKVSTCIKKKARNIKSYTLPITINNLDQSPMKSKIQKALIFSLIVFGAPVVSANELAAIKVVKIADGDTITVLTQDNTQVKIRLADIDCPERKQPWGNRAKQAIGNLLKDQPIRVETINKDRYGRTIGRVFADKQNINRALVEQGHCWVYPKYAKDEMLFKLQDNAQTAKRGLWRLPENERVPPWEWRKR